MTGNQAQHQRRLVVEVEIGPVHRDQDILALANLMRHPAGETVPNVDAVVTQQPVHLLDGMLCLQASGLRQRLADQRHRQRGGRHCAERSPGQRSDAPGVQVGAVEFANERSHIFKPVAVPSKPYYAKLQPAILAKALTDVNRIAPIAQPTEMRDS
jgi:hypothetical protein